VDAGGGENGICGEVEGSFGNKERRLLCTCDVSEAEKLTF
jgi:hypothetical protein